MGDTDATQATAAPLLSNRFLGVTISVIAALAFSSLAISLAGRHYGRQLALGDHSDRTTPVEIIIGRDRLILPENTLRFEEQRQSGVFEQIDLSLSWPELKGYEPALRSRFDSVEPAGILFLQISQSTMTRDMSGRLDPIYRQLLATETLPGPAGLEGRHFQAGTGYEGEILYTGRKRDGTVYAVRCLDRGAGGAATNSDCQRDIHVGQDLTVLYRFPQNLLPEWEKLENSIRAYIGSRHRRESIG